MNHQRLRGPSPGDESTSFCYYRSQPPPQPSSLQQSKAYIYPSGRTVRRWAKQLSISPPSRGDPVSSHQRVSTSTVELTAPQYYILNRPYLKVTTPAPPKAKPKTGTVYYPSRVPSGNPAAPHSGTKTPCEWETDNESDCDRAGFSSIGSSLYEDGNTRLSVLSSLSKPKNTYKPPRRTFTEYLWQYTQRLRKKGKRVRFALQPTEIPAKPEHQGGYNPSRNSKRSTTLQTGVQSAKAIPLTRAEYGRSSSSSSGGSGLAMGSAVSKHSLGHASTRSRSRRYYSRTTTQPQRITLPYSSSRDVNSGGSSRPAAQTYAIISYPEYYPSTYIDATPESAYYLGTESIPALHSLGRPSPKSTPGKSGKSGSSRGGTSKYRDDHGKGKMTAHVTSPDYHYGYYYQAVPKPPHPMVYRHQHRGTTAMGGAQGVYVLAPDVGYLSQEASTSKAKRGREQSTGRMHGRQKKLRRAKGVDDIRGSLRGRPAAISSYHDGWVSVGA